MKHLLVGFLTGLVVALVATSLAAWWSWNTYGRAAYNTWPVVKFTPACEHYEPNAGDYISELLFLEGEPSDEFWLLLTQNIKKYSKWIVINERNISTHNGKVYTTLSEYFNRDGPGKKFEGQREEWFVWVSANIAEMILERRKAEGAFTADDQKDFMVFRKRWNMYRPMAVNECGFVEELIMKGGRFAGE